MDVWTYWSFLQNFVLPTCHLCCDSFLFAPKSCKRPIHHCHRPKWAYSLCARPVVRDMIQPRGRDRRTVAHRHSHIQECVRISVRGVSSLEGLQRKSRGIRHLFKLLTLRTDLSAYSDTLRGCSSLYRYSIFLGLACPAHNNLVSL